MTHLVAIQGSKDIPELGNVKEMRPRTVLALSAAAVRLDFLRTILITDFVHEVERALLLWENGQITIEGIAKDEHKGKNSTKGIRKGISKITGRETARALAFGDFNWGEQSRLYMVSIMGLKDSVWGKVHDSAQAYTCIDIKGTKTGSTRSRSQSVPDHSDGRACLVSLSDVKDLE